MNEKQAALVEEVRTRLHQFVAKMERLRYMVVNQPEVTDGALTIWFGDELLCLTSKVMENDSEYLTNLGLIRLLSL